MTQANKITGAEIVIKALIDQGVDTVFGYPGGAILPIYDELFQQKKIKTIFYRFLGIFFQLIIVQWLEREIVKI